MEMDKIPFIDKTKMMIQTEQDTSVYYLITYPHTGFQSSTPKLQTTCSSKEIKQFSAKGSCGQVKKGKRLEGEEKWVEKRGSFSASTYITPIALFRG